jgi:hypothetical protein
MLAVLFHGTFAGLKRAGGLVPRLDGDAATGQLTPLELHRIEQSN